MKIACFYPETLFTPSFSTGEDWGEGDNESALRFFSSLSPSFPPLPRGEMTRFYSRSKSIGFASFDYPPLSSPRRRKSARMGRWSEAMRVLRLRSVSTLSNSSRPS